MTPYMMMMMVAAAAMAVAAQAPAAPGGQGGRSGAPASPPMVLSSPAFPDGAVIPNRYTQVQQAERGVSPALNWANAPAGTQSFVLHMHDLDVARNRTTDTQVHWVVWNIPGGARGLDEGLPRGERLPNGAHQTSATGPVYRGPGAPASGPKHHYIFELYALDTVLDVTPGADAFETRARVMEAMQGHVIGKTAYSGLFRRPQ
jgi:Raf kinase inhibitor-like YbhB/YbcL family protein